jgi:hypothetical protein
MADRKTVLESLGMVRLYRSVYNLARRFRRQFSSLVQRTATAESSRAANAASVPMESVRLGLAPTKVASTIALPIVNQVPPLCGGLCHQENKSIRAFSKTLALAPVPESMPPKVENFPLFATFPPEIRVQVWQYSASFERIVEIQYAGRSKGIRHSASPRPPAILHVCSESRHEALKVYKPCFGTRKIPKSMYINPTSDILFFRVAAQSQTWRFILGPNSLWREQLKNVRRIAFTYTGSNNVRFMKKTICSFPNLEELIILWAEDAYARPLEGRGVSYMEPVPGNGENKRYSSWQSAMRWKANIESEFWSIKFERETPVISVRHWCMRNASEWG